MKTLVHSRKFWLAVWALVQTVTGHYVQLPVDIIIALDAVVLVLIGSIAYEDGQAKSAKPVLVNQPEGPVTVNAPPVADGTAGG